MYHFMYEKMGCINGFKLTSKVIETKFRFSVTNLNFSNIIRMRIKLF